MGDCPWRGKPRRVHHVGVVGSEISDPAGPSNLDFVDCPQYAIYE
jgi:hypothetical protein